MVQADGPLNGYRVPRKNYFGGRWIRHLGWYPDYTLRLWRRGRGRFRDREVMKRWRWLGRWGILGLAEPTTPIATSGSTSPA